MNPPNFPVQIAALPPDERKGKALSAGQKMHDFSVTNNMIMFTETTHNLTQRIKACPKQTLSQSSVATQARQRAAEPQI
jgi:hypothetical protein